MSGRGTTTAATSAAVLLSVYGIFAGTIAPAPPETPETPGTFETSETDETSKPPETFCAVEMIDQAQVSVGSGRELTTCKKTPRRRGLVCGTQDWSWVGPHAGRAAGEVVRCLWIHPHPKNKTTRILWKQVKIGAHLSARLFLLRGSGDGATVHARVDIGRAQAALVEAKNEFEPGRFEGEIPPGPKRDRLRIEIDAKNNRWRLACLQLSMTGERSDPRAPPSKRRREAARLPRLPAIPSLGLELPTSSSAATAPSGEASHAR